MAVARAMDLHCFNVTRLSRSKGRREQASKQTRNGKKEQSAYTVFIGKATKGPEGKASRIESGLTDVSDL